MFPIVQVKNIALYAYAFDLYSRSYILHHIVMLFFQFLRMYSLEVVKGLKYVKANTNFCESSYNSKGMPHKDEVHSHF